METSASTPLPGSQIYFCTPTALIRREFLYPICLGHFFCDRTYHVERSSYDSFLLLYVRSGSGYLTYAGKHFHLNEDEFCCIDCYQPHTYGTDSSWEIQWIHFDGISAGSYYQWIIKQNGYVFQLPKSQTMQALIPLQHMLDIFAMHVPYNEIWLSKYITDLLSFLLEMPDYTLFTSSDNAVSEHASTVSERAISYMQQRFSSNLTMEELADHVSLNLSYFIRCFKKETGMTPHSYLISIRLQQAVYYLKTTDRTVKDIGFACGLQSENSFCITIKKHKGYTPSEYRSLPH